MPERLTVASAVDPSAAQQQRVMRVAAAFVALALLVMLALLGRVIQLQMSPAPRVADKVEHRGTSTNILARRGAIYDTRGRPLAVTRLGRRLFVDPGLIQNPGEFSLHVANAIGDDPARIDRIIDERFDRRYAVIDRLLTERQHQAVRSLDLPGLATEPIAVRHYPQATVAGQIVGFVGAEHKGLDGIEYALDSVLRGKLGEVRTLRDARRRPLWIEQTGFAPSADGYDVRLSIDARIQQIAETELAATCEGHDAENGRLVVMDSRNGQLLAIANWPFFDPRDPAAFDANVRKNRCITDPYEPGSTFKPILHAISSEMGLARPTDIIDCTEQGYWKAGPRVRLLRDTHPYGKQTWDGVLVVSSNIGMAKVAMKMGAQKMHDAVRSFGFGQETGVGLAGESPGIVNPVKIWNPTSLTRVPMGQEVAVTAVQMARAFSVFANGGVMVSPSILAGEADSTLYQRVISRKWADHTRGVLRKVVSEGTGKLARSDLYQIWGKTGTPQVALPDGKGYNHTDYAPNFIGAAPLAEPRIIVVCVVYKPDKKKAYYGGKVAAPAAKRVIDQTLLYLGEPPDVEGAVVGAEYPPIPEYPIKLY